MIRSHVIEMRSSLVNKIISAKPDAYKLLVVEDDTSAGAHELLDGVGAEQLVVGEVKSPMATAAMLGGLWLWCDGLEECHAIVQKDGGGREMTATLAYWHAIMHRREGDFSNSKYWLAKCGNHPAFREIASGLPGLIENSDPALARLTKGGWDPFAMVDLVERVCDRANDPLHLPAVAVQRLEWNCLFAYCVQVAGPGRE
jgi:hypothetical protein